MAIDPSAEPGLLTQALDREGFEGLTLRHNFYAVLLDLEQRHCTLPRLGSAPRPMHEPVRLSQWPHLTFAVRDLEQAQVSQSAGQAVSLWFNNFGLWGPHGALPTHMTEYVLLRMRHYNDHGLRAFADVFHHRMMLLFYRAWANAKPHVAWRQSDLNPYTRGLADLSGHGIEAFEPWSELPMGLRAGGASQLLRASRPAEGLVAWLRKALGCRAQVLDLHAKWLELSPNQQWRLGASSPQLKPRLGAHLVLGKRTPTASGRVQLRLGPLPWDLYWRLHTEPACGRRVTQALLAYFGLEFEPQCMAEVQAAEVPRWRLGQGALGRSTWAARRPLHHNPIVKISSIHSLWRATPGVTT